jgi:hypothetical protein
MQYIELKEKIKGLSLQSLDGKSIPVASLWTDRQLVLAFLRHFG